MIIQAILPKNIKVMPKSAFIFWLFLLILLRVTPGFAISKKMPAKLKTDTSVIVVRKFNSHAIDSLKKNPDFIYTGEPVGYNSSLWDRFWNWIWNFFARLFAKAPVSGTVLKYVLLAASVGALIYFILKSAGIDMVRLWRGEARKIDVPYSESLENIHEIDFDAEIQKAVDQLNFRLAVRLLYLKCLKQLSDKNLIHWQIDKTNTAYISELTDPEQKQTFRQLTLRFEYVWYGDFPIDREAFGGIDRLFSDFKKQLS